MVHTGMQTWSTQSTKAQTERLNEEENWCQMGWSIAVVHLFMTTA